MRFSVLKLSQIALQCALLLPEFGPSNAFQTNLRARKLIGPSRTLDRRGVHAGHSDVISVMNEYDTGYSMPINLGGVDLEVLIDLGSTDLVVKAHVPETRNTHVPVSVAYGTGNGSGFVNQATLKLGAFSIKNQAYANLEKTQDLFFPKGVSGIFGIGPRFNSEIFGLLNGTVSSEPPLDRIISGDTSVDNFFTLLLSRVLDGDSNVDNDYGYLTIGSVLDKYQDIAKQPKLPMWQDPLGVGFQHWEALVDEDGLIGPDGQPVPTRTIYKTGPPRQLKAMFDSGWTYPAVPDYVAEAIYGRVPNAHFNASGQYWAIPCSYELNISFSFGGVRYPIHPLDVAVPFDFNLKKLPNNMCMGTYQPYNFTQGALSGLGELDIIMGMAFLRNTYFLGDYGNYTSSLSSSSQLPHIQLLSTTDPAVAHEEFVKVRLEGKDTTHSQPELLPLSAISGPTPSNGKSKSVDAASGSASGDTEGTTARKPWYKRTPIIISIVVSSLALLAALAGVALYFCRRRARSSKVPRESAFVPDMVGKSSYKPLLAEAAPMATGGRSESPVSWVKHGQYSSHGADTSYTYGGYNEPKYEHA